MQLFVTPSAWWGVTTPFGKPFWKPRLETFLENIFVTLSAWWGVTIPFGKPFLKTLFFWNFFFVTLSAWRGVTTHLTLVAVLHLLDYSWLHVGDLQLNNEQLS